MPEPERPNPYDRRPSMPWDVRAVVDVTVPSVARGYDYGLGGKNNFEVDRRAVDEILEDFPGALELAWANRQFLRRGVEYLVGEAGVTQLIEVGCGMPAQEQNVHEIAHAINPAVRVVYTDRDASVVAHVRAMLAHESDTTVFVANAAAPASILGDPFTRRFIDLDEPYAVLLAGVLHHLSDAEDPVGVTAYFRDRMPADSYLLACGFLGDDPRAGELEEAVVSRFGSGWFRPWETHRRFFAGLEMVEPGLVYTNDWRPDEHTELDTAWHTFSCAGVGRRG